jgi:hypothetical protein
MSHLPIVLSVVAVAILCIGLPRARRVRQPSRFTLGIILVAAGLVSLWTLQVLVARRATEAELRWVLHIIAFLVSVSLFGGGLQAISRANNTARDDFWED